MKTLHLNIKRKWFDMLFSGTKTEEYREINEYWKSRLVKYVKNHSYLFNNPQFLKKNEIEFKHFDTVTFSNGYAKNRQQFTIKLLGIKIGKGRTEWGAEYHKNYFVLSLDRARTQYPG